MPLSASQAAAWMKDQLLQASALYQGDVVGHLQLEGGDDLLIERDDGGFSLCKELLAEFRSITSDIAIWERSEKAWRLRDSADPDGRLA